MKEKEEEEEEEEAIQVHKSKRLQYKPKKFHEEINKQTKKSPCLSLSLSLYIYIYRYSKALKATDP